MKLPSSAHKRYLGGADWCLATLNHGTRETTGRRATFHVAVLLAGAPDADRMESGFRTFCERFPVLWGALARCWCLAPYWKYPPSPDPTAISVTRSSLPAGAPQEEVVRWMEARANAGEPLRGCAVSFHILRIGEAEGALGFSFDHHLFDAGGAERFSDLFFRFLNGEARAGDFPEGRPTAPARLDGWIRRFLNAHRVRQWMRRLGDPSAAALPLPGDASRRPFRFRVASFGEEDSRRVKDRAFEVAGYLMFMPYVLATAAAAFGPFFRKRSAPDAQFVVSVSTDKPKGMAVHAPHFFFNDLSFLYFNFPPAAGDDRNALAGALREQLIAQVKDELPAAVEDANLLMRILPVATFWKFLMHLYRNQLASFAFTCLGTPALKTAAVLGCPVRGHLHLPIIPTPPGIGLILSRSGGAYHAVLSYIEGILPEDEIDALMESFRAKLLDAPVRAEKG